MHDPITQAPEDSAEIFISEPFLHPGEALFLLSALLLALALASTHFVMGIFFAALPAGLSVLLAPLGLLRARGRRGSRARLAGGFFFLALALAAALILGFYAARLSYELAFHQLRPTAMAAPAAGDFGRAALTWLILPAMAAPGLNFWTEWSPQRLRRWCILAFSFPILVFFLHQVLAAGRGPLSA
jgi:hypothetical protein